MASGCLFILNDLLMWPSPFGTKGIALCRSSKACSPTSMSQPSWIYIESEGSVPSAFWLYLPRVGKGEPTFLQHTTPRAQLCRWLNSLDFCSIFWLHHFGASQEPTLLPFKESQWASPLPPRIVRTYVTAVCTLTLRWCFGCFVGFSFILLDILRIKMREDQLAIDIYWTHSPRPS